MWQVMDRAEFETMLNDVKLAAQSANMALLHFISRAKKVVGAAPKL